MKRKLIIVLFLTTLLLTGIIALQAYWSFSAYKLNKEKFDGDINTAMQQALDSCKKDYFDSVRVVMVKRLSAPGTKIKLDTIHGQDTVHVGLTIKISNPYMAMGEPYQTTIADFNYYRRKINHAATVPEVITEMSFYVPTLLDQVMLCLGLEDISSNWKKVDTYLKAHADTPSDSIFAHTQIVQTGIYGFPPKYRQADSIKLYNYYRITLHKMHRYADFDLQISDKPIPATKADPHLVDQLRYSETNEYTYKYHGFLLLQHTEKNNLYIRAVFNRAQIGVLKEMVIALIASGFLIVFTIFCLFYIIRTIIQQKKLTELKDDFINNMTHELKTPIATITVAIEGLQKFNGLNDPDKTQRYLQTSRNELSRLNDLVSKVLNIASFEKRKVELVKDTILVDELINDIIASETAKANKKVEFTYTNSGDVQSIEADSVHFRNVLVNLVDNGIKYSAEPAQIAISVYRQKRLAVFSVKDNGIGIPAAHIKHVFDKFHRVPTGNIHNVKGTGLGLSYVKYIVHAHGGDIAVKSQVNTGTEFIITIPLTHG